MAAKEKINVLEQKVEELTKKFDLMMKASMEFENAIKAINENVHRLSKTVQGIIETTDVINKDSVNGAVIKQNVEELKQKAQFLKDKGLIVESDVITENSFIVGREFDIKGNEINPRIQFALSVIPNETAKNLIGKKVGDSFETEKGKQTLTITEIYSVVIPEEEKPGDNLPS